MDEESNSAEYSYLDFEDEELATDDHLGGPSQVVGLADDHPGYLVLNGGQPGSIVSTPPKDSVTRAGDAPAVPSRDEALDGRLPLFLLSAGQRSPVAGREVLAALHADHGRYLRLGVTASIPRHPENKIVRLFECAVAAVRIADPECFLVDHGRLVLKSDDPADYNNEEMGAEAARAAASRQQRAPYLNARQDPTYVKRVLDAQRAAGANLLLSPGNTLDPANVRSSLDQLIADGERVLADLDGDERMALNVTIPLDCLLNATYMEMILGELLEQQQFDTWYVRGQWRNNGEGANLRDVSVLRAYKEICNLAEDEERTLIFPQTGLTGWYMLSHGATGFGTGTAGSDQAFLQYRRAMRRPGTANIQYFFERGLVHSIEFPTHLGIKRNTSYIPCKCDFCDDIARTDIYNATLAQWHGVYNQGFLAAMSQRGARRSGRGQYIRKTLRNAQKLSGQMTLLGKDDPKHLSTWLELL